MYSTSIDAGGSAHLQEVENLKMSSIERTAIQATDEAIEAAFSAHGYGICADADERDLSYAPAEELARFKAARNGWAERGTVLTNTVDAFVVERVQPFKGARRRDVVVIRFGDFVAIYGMDH